MALKAWFTRVPSFFVFNNQYTIINNHLKGFTVAKIMNEADRKLLMTELAEIEINNIGSDGLPTADAVPQELARRGEIQKLLEESGGAAIVQLEDMDYQALQKIAGELGLNKVQKTEVLIAAIRAKQNESATSNPVKQPKVDETSNTTVPGSASTNEGESEQDELARLRSENKELKKSNTQHVKRHARSAAGNKMRSADTQGKHVKRPDEIMDEALEDAEDRHESDWDDSNKVAVERTIRRSVRRGGSAKNHKGDFYDMPAGFKKGIGIEEMRYALGLLEQLGRLTCPADDIIGLIEDRTKLTVAEVRTTAKDFNLNLEGLGVTWDENIQVPGMSELLKGG